MVQGLRTKPPRKSEHHERRKTCLDFKPPTSNTMKRKCDPNQ